MADATIRIQNNYSWLVSNQKVMTDLWRAFRVRELNYIHSRLYKQKLWDGYTEYFKKESGRFLTGLLPEVEAAMKYWNINYVVKDERGSVVFNEGYVDVGFLNQWLAPGSDPIYLFDYQVELVNQVLKYHRGIVMSPTASGKTNILISILKKLPPKTPTLVLANRTSLVDQNYDEIQKWGFADSVGKVYGKFNQPNYITCSTIQSIHKIEALLPKIKVLLVDEIHELMSKEPKKVYNKLKSCSVRVGISATPFKFGERDKSQKMAVKGYFGPVLKIKSAAAEGGVVKTHLLQKQGILAKSKAWFIKVKEPELLYDVYLDAVTNGIANNWHFHHMVQNLVTNLTGRTLIIVDRIAHGDALQSMMTDALWVKGEDNIETRKGVIEQLQKLNKANVVGIATQGIFNTGINVHVHNLINAAGGQADHQIIQRMGRGLRTADDKDGLNYYDFFFQINPYLENHSNKRIKILQKEGHEVTILESVEQLFK